MIHLDRLFEGMSLVVFGAVIILLFAAMIMVICSTWTGCAVLFLLLCYCVGWRAEGGRWL